MAARAARTRSPITHRSSRILGLADAKGTILLATLDSRDAHVLAAQAQPRVQAGGNGRVEAFLLLHRTARVQRQLDEDAILGPLDAKVVLVGDVALWGVLLNDLEAVILRG